MTLNLGYDPRRIRQLTHRTIESIEALASIRSGDPAAEAALRAVRNTRRNLEDTWMPLLREIGSDDTMAATRTATVVGLRAEWSTTSGWLDDRSRRELDDDELLTEVARLDEEVPLVADDATGAAFERWLDRQHGLANELARRVATDPAFAADVTTAAYASPLIGLLAGRASFPADFRADLLATTLAHPWWEAGWEMDKYAGAANTLLATMLDDPARCLDVLGRDGAAAALAGWPPLDRALVADFVLAGLGDAPRADHDRLPAAYGVLQGVVRLANERPLDGDGFQPGFAAGLARSIGVYVPTLVPGLENEHAPVVVKSHGVDGEFDLTLGSREEVVDLFGAILRTPEAQIELGAVLDSSIRDALGERPQLTIGAAAEFAELIELAASNENEELSIAAATRRSNLLRIGGLVGLGVAVGTAVAGVGAAVRSAAAYSTASMARNVAATVGPGDGSRLRRIAYQSIQIEACRRFADDPGLRSAIGAGAVGAGPLRSIAVRLAEVESLLTDPDAAPGDRQQAILNLVESVRDAGGGPYLDRVLEDNSVDDLNEATHEADL